MPIENWIAYAIATELILIIPGPSVLLVVGYALSHGQSAGLKCVLGCSTGAAFAFIVAFAGLGTLLAASSTAFTVLKLVGAAYLVYLGIKMWRSKPKDLALSDPTESGEMNGWRNSPYLHGLITTVLNPKVVVFLVAFVPQFMDPAAAALPQAIIMTATFAGLALISDGGYAVAASRARGLFLNARTAQLMNRVGGSLLIGAGIFTAVAKRSS